MTNLDKDLAMMKKLGYGPHYGAYKADHPNTREKEPEEILTNTSAYGTCRNCGRKFSKQGRGYRKLYCDDTCRIQYNSRIEHEKTQERRKRNGQSL